MGLTWFVLLVLYGPFEILGSIMSSARSVWRVTSRRRAGLGGQVRYDDDVTLRIGQG